MLDHPACTVVEMGLGAGGAADGEIGRREAQLLGKPARVQVESYGGSSVLVSGQYEDQVRLTPLMHPVLEEVVDERTWENSAKRGVIHEPWR